MYFEEQNEGDYRIYAGALELRDGGYLAAVVIQRRQGVAAPVEAFRDIGMAGGRRWDSADEALLYAITTARTIIRKSPKRLRC